MSMVNHNGTVVDITSVGLQDISRAARYGDGLFESIRMLEGHIPFLRDHLERLSAGMELLHLSLDHKPDEPWFIKELEKLPHSSNARLRLSVFRLGGGLYTPQSENAAFIIEAEPYEGNSYELNQEGLKIGLFKQGIVRSTGRLSNFKTNNALVSVTAGYYAAQKSYDEVAVLNTTGRVCDGVSSNIFVVMGKDIITPALDEGCVAGVMRKQLLSIAKELGYSAAEWRIKPKDLSLAEEIFFSNALKGIQWVGNFRKKTYSNKISAILHAQLNRIVQKP